MKKLILILISLSIFGIIVSCSDDNKPDNIVDDNCCQIGTLSYYPASCSQEDKNNFVYKVMNDTYLWYDKVVETEYTDYASTEDLLSALKYEELDKWSYITSKEAYHSYYEEGKFIGIGYGLKYDVNNDVRIGFVYKNSPAEVAGLQRGDVLLAINGSNIAEIEENYLWDIVSGPNEPGVEVRLKIMHNDGSIREYNLVKDWVMINTVLYSDIIRAGDLKIGYLVFNSFLETSKAELDSVFNHFKREVIDELIIDLRYNSGGRLLVAKYLASLIAGAHAEGKVYCKIVYNDKYKCCDRVSNFIRLPNSLSLNRVLIISSNKTCSASESVINSLKPFIEVVVIGDTTCGKPVGMHGYDFCDKHIAPIEFQLVNANDNGDYFDGISPLCYSDDDLTKNFGDIEEDSLKKALYYIRNGYCESDTLKKPSKALPDNIFKGFRGEIGAF